MSPKYTPEQLAELIRQKLSHNFGVTPEQASDEFFYNAAVLVLLDIMRGIKHGFRDKVYEEQPKMIYYLSMEFLMGRSLKNNLYNLGLTDAMEGALASMGVKLDQIYKLNQLIHLY